MNDPECKMQLYRPYATRVMQNEELDFVLASVRNFPVRRHFSPGLDAFLAGGPSPEVAVLYGVRRTGKTTAILQSILHLPEEERKKAVFFQIRDPNAETGKLLKGDTVQDLENDIRRLLGEGKKYFFVDEATRLIDFQHGADVFPDVLARCGGRIVLSGTDSLCLDDARKNKLQGRVFPLTTSHIFFHEWSAISDSDCLDDFARLGGILGTGKQVQELFGTEDGCEDYVQSAYAENLQHSIQDRKHANIPQEILDLADEGRLESAIQRIVEDLNHRVTAKILRKNLSLSSIGSLRDLIEKDVRRAREKGFSVSELLAKKIQLSCLQHIDEQQLIQWMSLCLQIRDESIKPDKKTADGFEPVSQQAAQYLERELVRLDVLSPFPIRKIQEDGSVIDGTRNLLVQHGLKYFQATVMAECLANDPMFVSLFASDKDSLLKRMEWDILGHVAEEIVLLDAQKALADKNARLFMLGLPRGEIDLAIQNTRSNDLSLFEIKHSSEIDPEQQAVHLMNKEIMALIQKAFAGANIVSRTVLVNNNKLKPTTINDINYKNIGSFLKELHDNPLKTIFRS